MNEFDFDIENRVLTRVVNEFSDTLKQKYKDIDFTTSDVQNTEPRFPTVYIHELPGYEMGQDLDNVTVNGMMVGIQIEVSDNVSKSRAKEVMREVGRIMKTMRFSFNQMPYSDYRKDTYYCIARCRRVFGAGDNL